MSPAKGARGSACVSQPFGKRDDCGSILEMQKRSIGKS
ncbi:hypothetical protein EGR_09058 [Echinococcus granulosus]|uniref:Uncharacterized protein n=1 Tax=Echinococcus granulosus TaxID=6210 RepID=W6U4K5_ECHGR|nr:hypothetical protein EGR_09058 [Echinococcus granulosus]EUB56068.1 hypothetical protein EGR_09058 [Echinococcus granulosus]